MRVRPPRPPCRRRGPGSAPTAALRQTPPSRPSPTPGPSPPPFPHTLESPRRPAGAARAAERRGSPHRWQEPRPPQTSRPCVGGPDDAAAGAARRVRPAGPQQQGDGWAQRHRPPAPDSRPPPAAPAGGGNAGRRLPAARQSQALPHRQNSPHTDAATVPHKTRTSKPRPPRIPSRRRPTPVGRGAGVEPHAANRSPCPLAETFANPVIPAKSPPPSAPSVIRGARYGRPESRRPEGHLCGNWFGDTGVPSTRKCAKVSGRETLTGSAHPFGPRRPPAF